MATKLLPGVTTEVVTQTRGVSIPGGSRIAAMIGEGSTPEVIVSQAIGSGQDGLNDTYTSTTGADGRHFLLSNFPVVSNRTVLFKNGIPLTGLESLINDSTFPNKYDYRIDIESGEIELQIGHLLDQGGSFYVPLSTNVGQGTINNLTLEDVNAQPEIWTIRCVGVQRNSMNQPIAGTAKFLAFGSISGTKLDANGNPIIWQANNSVVSNDILSFSIQETEVLSTVISPFRDGDAFTIKIASGVLTRSDSLTAVYIPESFINDPLLLQGMNDVANRHGFPSLTNNLSLGAQLAFANQAPVLVTVQAAPPMPRRQSFILDESVDSTSTNVDDFIFPLPIGVTPDFNSNIHFFVTDNTTEVETQILPNKLDFYTLGTSGFPTESSFIFDDTQAPAGYSYFYTVIQDFANLATGFDGYIGRDQAFTNRGVFSSSIEFDSTYVGKQLKIIDATNVANQAEYTINNVINGDLYVTRSSTLPDFTNETSLAFEVIEPTTLLPIDSATDGTLVALISTTTGTLNSNTVTGVDFSTITNLLQKKLQINGSTDNNGLYDIIAFDSFSNTITIQKTVVTESNMRYEVLDLDDESNYVVINHNVVPNGFQLRVTVIDAKDAPFYDAGWINALESLEAVECDILVPLPKQTISVIFQNALAHCKAMSNLRNKKERVLFIGAISGLTPDNVTGVEPAAVEDIGILEGIQGDSVTEVLEGNVEDLANYSVPDAFGNTFRCVYFYPDQIVVQVGTENALIDGFYIAAAAAGFESADLKIENPLTNKTLTGFTILRDKQFSTAILERLQEAGISCLQPIQGGGLCIHGVTTTQSGFVEEEEISIVFIRDRVSKIMRAAFRGFIGTPEDVNTGTLLNTRAVTVLNSLVGQHLITAYRDLVVKQSELDPTLWNISVAVRPVYPLNYIHIRIEVGQL